MNGFQTQQMTLNALSKFWGPALTLGIIILTLAMLVGLPPCGAEEPRLPSFDIQIRTLTPQELGWTKLMKVVATGDIEAVKLLLAQGADVNAKGNYGSTALTLAAGKGYNDIVRLLVAQGGDINARKNNGNTALLEAVVRGQAGIVQTLLENGADANIVGGRGQSPLQHATVRRNVGIVRSLVDHGADIHLRDRNGKTVLSAMSMSGQKDVMELLLRKGVDVNQRNEDGSTALHSASWRGDAAVVRTLLEKKADANAKDKSGQTPLFIAASKNHASTVQALLSGGADVNLSDKRGVTALILAVQKGHEDISRILLEIGADVSITDHQGQTALVYADQAGFEALGKALLEKEPPLQKAISLIYVREEQGDCELKMWNPVHRTRKLLHSFKDCPKDIFVDEHKHTLFIITETTIQEIEFSPEVNPKPPIEIPFKLGAVQVDGQRRWTSLKQAGYLEDGRLAVLKANVRPADDMDVFLLVLEGKQWIMVDQKYCDRERCTLGNLSAHHWMAWKREKQIWHPRLYLNPFVVERGAVERAGTDFIPKEERRSSDKESWRYIKFSFKDHESMLYHASRQGDHSYGLYMFSIYLKTYKDKAPIQISSVQNNTAIENKYLLLNRYFQEGLDLIDLETGDTLIDGLESAFWVY